MPVVNKRLANKVIWALEDIDHSVLLALGMWEKAFERAELKCADPALIIALTKIRNELSDIHILAAAARDGEYAGRRFIVYDPEHEE